MKNLHIILISIITLSIGLVTVVSAGHHYHGHCTFNTEMKEMDANRDGLLTLDEFSAPHMDRLGNYFKMLDTDNDDVISSEEWDAFVAAHSYGYTSKKKEMIQ